MSIATQGYEFFSCARLPGYDPKLWCGNTGWLPTLPFLMRLLGHLGMSPASAGVLIAQTCALATLILIWNCFLERDLTTKGLLALTFCAFFPSFVYQHAVFPLSLCALFHVLALSSCSKQQYARAGLFGACAAFSYSSGVFLAGVFGLYLLAAGRDKPLLQQFRQLLLASGLTAAGFAAFHLLLWMLVGVWNAYFKVQAKYKFQPTWPWETVYKHWRPLVGPEAATLPDVQTVLIAVLALVLIWGAARAPRRPVDGLLATFLAVYWLLPLSLGGDLSLYRAEAVLLPAAPLVRKLPLPVLVSVVAVAVYLGGRIAVLFFRNVLV